MTALHTVPKTIYFSAKNSFVFAMSICLIAVSAQLSIPLPNNPIPIIWYMNLMYLYAALKGPWQGVQLVVAYLALAFLGAPILANGAGGPLCFLGPSGGYFIGFIPATFVVGYLCQHGFDKNKGLLFLAFLLGNSLVYFFGIPHLSLFLGIKGAFYYGLVPFLPGFLIKNFMATIAYCFLRSRW
jgi:biotin transport system substrate-specific component